MQRPPLEFSNIQNESIHPSNFDRQSELTAVLVAAVAILDPVWITFCVDAARADTGAAPDVLVAVAGLVRAALRAETGAAFVVGDAADVAGAAGVLRAAARAETAVVGAGVLVDAAGADGARVRVAARAATGAAPDVAFDAAFVVAADDAAPRRWAGAASSAPTNPAKNIDNKTIRFIISPIIPNILTYISD